MKNVLKAIACLLRLLPVARAADETADLRLVLLIGQSNMAGRGKVTPADQQTHPRIFMLDRASAWVPAKDPVHFSAEALRAFGGRYYEAFARLADAVP